MRKLEIEQHHYSQDLKCALEAVQRAGEFLLRSYSNQNKIKTISERDVKIEEDVLSEEIILDKLCHSGYSILSEEKGELSSDGDSELRWIVDPLDGTYNYLRRIPFCAVSLALWKGEEPIFGIVNSFCLHEIFIGIVGTGAWCNGNSIQAGRSNTPKNSIIASGFPSSFKFSENSVSVLLEDAAAYKKIRMLGSAATSLAYLAAGRIDAYREEDIMLWDVAGGLAIVKAAGGTYSCIRSGDANQCTVKASSKKIAC